MERFPNRNLKLVYRDFLHILLHVFMTISIIKLIINIQPYFCFIKLIKKGKGEEDSEICMGYFQSNRTYLTYRFVFVVFEYRWGQRLTGLGKNTPKISLC